MTFKAEQLASTLVIGSQYVDDVAGFVAQAVKAGVSMVILNEAQLTGVEKQNLAEYITRCNAYCRCCLHDCRRCCTRGRCWS
ncbi:hypothetical protein [Weissella confusa]|uniref:hypothetical protein n=1 Tax=Weissella confusa TaxID=1583 RepID=UPI00223A8DD5|nr:hypothetical protein [Weissella confusa]